MNAPTPENRDGHLDAYFEQFGERFHDATGFDRTSTSSRRRRSAGRWALGGGVVLAVVVVVLVGVLPGSVGSHKLDVVASAEAALEPRGEIVHMTITGSFVSPTSTVSNTTEQWSAENPRRWRLVTTIQSSATSKVRDGAGGVIEGREEFSYADGIQQRYLVERNILDVSPAVDDRGIGAFGLPNGEDPADELRKAVASGEVIDHGEEQLNGRTVRRLASVRGTGSATRRFTYDVDPDTFAPVAGELRLDGDPTEHYEFRVDSYERLPLTAANVQLLKVKTNSATVVRKPQDLRPTRP